MSQKLLNTIGTSIAFLSLYIGAGSVAFADSSSPTNNEDAVVITSPGTTTTWTSSSSQSLALKNGSLIVFSGANPVKVETIIGVIEVPSQSGVLVQNSSGQSVSVTAIGSRQHESNSVLSVCSNDGSVYKLGLGQQVKVAVDAAEEGACGDITLSKQPPALCSIMQMAATELGSTGLSDKQVASQCITTLLAVAEGVSPTSITTDVATGESMQIFVANSMGFVPAQPGLVKHDASITASANVGKAIAKNDVGTPAELSAQKTASLSDDHELRKAELASGARLSASAGK